ncbi:MAG TPA: SHOCT domain-containing protein [Alphaproteobacteria bacterium]|nr:SHOCT domain-containing protein [Alphaproteobacteria bacterium]
MMYQAWNYPGMMMGSGWMIGFHALFWLVVLGVLVAVAFALIRQFSQSSGERRSDSSALAILEARYARGEIDREEFLQRKKDLT